MIGIFLKFFAIAVGIVLLVFSIANVFRNARRLNRRIEDFKAEQETLQRKGGPINPYAMLGDVYGENDGTGDDKYKEDKYKLDRRTVKKK